MPLPIVREKTGSAELRISNETQLAIIWKKKQKKTNVDVNTEHH